MVSCHNFLSAPSRAFICRIRLAICDPSPRKHCTKTAHIHSRKPFALVCPHLALIPALTAVGTDLGTGVTCNGIFIEQYDCANVEQLSRVGCVGIRRNASEMEGGRKTSGRRGYSVVGAYFARAAAGAACNFGENRFAGSHYIPARTKRPRQQEIRRLEI